MATPTNDQDRLIVEALSLLRDTMSESKVSEAVQLRPAEDVEERPVSIGQLIPVTEEFETPPTGQQPGTEQASKNVPPPAPPLQEQQSASLIDKTLSMVAAAISESTVSQAPPPSLHQSVAKPIDVKEGQTVSLIAEALLMVKGVSTVESKPVEAVQRPAKPNEAIPSSSQKPAAKELAAEERLAIERAAMWKRVETFKANQQRFQREREEYYEATMAKVRFVMRAE
jgi:hypothetical protein